MMYLFICVLYLSSFIVYSIQYSSNEAILHFSKKLFIVKYTYDANITQIIRHVGLWRHAFINQLISGPFGSDKVEKVSQLLPNGINVISSLYFDAGGAWQHKEIVRAISKFPEFNGYLFADQDLAFNVTALMMMNESRVWVSGSRWKRNLEERWHHRNHTWSHWNSYSGIDAMSRALADNEEIRATLTRCTGSSKTWYNAPGHMDILHIPASMKNLYVDVMNKFERVYIEIAVPTFVACFVSPVDIENLQVCQSWGKTRGNVTHMKDACPFSSQVFHPVKTDNNDMASNFMIEKMSLDDLTTLLKSPNNSLYPSLTHEDIAESLLQESIDTPDSEEFCKIVSSYGILKSSEIHPTSPRSSDANFNIDLSEIRNKSVVYITGSAILVFARHLHTINSTFIIVSGNCDQSIPEMIFKTDEDFKQFIESDKIIHWFSQNVVKSHPKLTSIPIGLDYHSRAPSPLGQEKELLRIRKSAPRFFQRIILCYANFHFNQQEKRHYTYDRKDAIKLVPNHLIYYEPNVTGRINSWSNQVKYAFVLSPHGNGLDCHRTWEAIALGCIPIVKSSPLDSLFDDLPVLIVREWSDVTELLLNETIKKFKSMHFNHKKITLKYWMGLINSKKNTI